MSIALRATPLRPIGCFERIAQTNHTNDHHSQSGRNTPDLSKFLRNLVFFTFHGVQTSASRQQIRTLRCEACTVLSEEVIIMGKGDNRQKNDKKNKKVKKDAKKPGIPTAVKKA